MVDIYKKDSGLVFVCALLIPQMVAVLFACFFKAFFKIDALSVVLSVIMQISMFIICFVYAKSKKHNLFKSFGFNDKLETKKVLIVALLSVISFVSLFYFNNLIDELISVIGIDISKFDVSIKNDTFLLLALNLVFVAMLPAFCEEFVFRGFVFSGIKNETKMFAYSAVLSSVMFALMHLSIAQFVYPIIMGFIFCYVFNCTKNIKYTMIFHFCNNALVLIVDYFKGLYFFDFNLTYNFLTVFLIVLIAIFGVLLIFLIVKFFLKNSNNSVENKGDITVKKTKIDKALLVSVLLAILLWISVFVETLKG